MHPDAGEPGTVGLCVGMYVCMFVCMYVCMRKHALVSFGGPSAFAYLSYMFMVRESERCV